MENTLAVATDAALAAGALLLERFGGPRTGVETKTSATDLVSDADRAAETLILARIRAAFPGDGTLGEETGTAPGTTGRRWIVDPLDGTTNFLFGLPMWCVSIACEDGDGPLAGVVHDPTRGETFAAERGRGATCNGRPIHVSDRRAIGEALIATGFSYTVEERAVQARMLAHVLPRVRDVRRGGSAALDLAWTAAGRFDGFYEAPIQRWDWAAGIVLVREAGGATGDLPAVGPSGPGVIAAAPALFGSLEALVAEAREQATAG